MNEREVLNSCYIKAYHLCENLLAKKLKQRGKLYCVDSSLVQSVLAHSEIVTLIKRKDFNESLYTKRLLAAIEETRKELFPDLAKKRFISFDQHPNVLEGFHYEDALISNHPPSKTAKSNVSELPVKNLTHLGEKETRHLKLFNKLYPAGEIADTTHFNSASNLTNQQIIDVYKNVLLGVERSFPKYFLKYHAEKRCAVLTRFLCKEILNIPVWKLTLEILDEYKLKNINRLFNYSISKIIRNACSEVKPWENGHASADYWNNGKNRIEAVQWLIEEKLCIRVRDCYKINVHKKDFARFGLSYLFNNYYNSVSAALLETFPGLKPWQTGTVPASFWNATNSSQAVKWMFEKLKWEITKLPAKYAAGELNRKTFGQFGLSGLFEKKFRCNLFNIIDYTFPGQFKEWEFQGLNKSFWRKTNNVRRFESWLSYKIVKTGRPMQFLQAELDLILQEYSFKKSFYGFYKSSGNFLRKIFINDYEIKKSLLLRKRWRNLVTKERKVSSPLHFLQYGFYFNLVKNVSTDYILTIERLAKRCERNSAFDDL